MEVLVKKEHKECLELFKSQFLKLFFNKSGIKESQNNRKSLDKFLIYFSRIDNLSWFFGVIKEKEVMPSLRENQMMRFTSFIRLFLYWLKDQGIILWPANTGDYILSVSDAANVRQFFTQPITSDLFEYKQKKTTFVPRIAIQA